MFRSVIAALVLALCAGAARAQEAPVVEGWTLVSEQALQEFYYQYAPPSAGHARLLARYEFFDEVDGYRSSKHLQEFDCKKGLRRNRESTYYRKPGLVDPINTGSSTKWLHDPAETVNGEALKIACDGEKPRAQAAFANLIVETSSALAWPPIEPLDWEEIYAGTRDFKLFVRPEPGQPSHLWLRLERPQPLAGVRSQTQLYEADCPGRKARTLRRTTYSRNNLTGEAAADEAPAPWSEPPANSNAGRVLARVCGG